MFADEAANILERAINGVLSRNSLLYYAYADFEEGRMKYEKVHQLYNKFIAIPDIDPTLVSSCKYFDTFYYLSLCFPIHIFIEIILDLCSIHEIRSSR